ncbi:transferase [Aureococcus anophagefferens]|nr:transferase [Aureococcus anophagefferens]
MTQRLVRSVSSAAFVDMVARALRAETVDDDSSEAWARASTYLAAGHFSSLGDRDGCKSIYGYEYFLVALGRRTASGLCLPRACAPDDLRRFLDGARFALDDPELPAGPAYVSDDRFRFRLDELGVLSAQVVPAAEFAVDTFFLLSGFLGATSLADAVLAPGAPGLAAWWPALVARRLARLVPAYAYVLLAYWKVQRVAGRGALWSGMEYAYELCDEYWWTNALLVNNLVPWGVDDRCYGPSWYIAVDAQLAVLALPPCVAVAARHGVKRGVAFLAALAAASTVFTCGARWRAEYAYLALSKPAWALGVAAVALLCFEGRGSVVGAVLDLDVWAPAARLTYCAYLVHAAVLDVVFHADAAQRIHYSAEWYVVTFLGAGAVIVVTSLAVHLLVEAPAAALLRGKTREPAAEEKRAGRCLGARTRGASRRPAPRRRRPRPSSPAKAAAPPAGFAGAPSSRGATSGSSTTAAR